jgi:glucose/arabinose dehydrogenase/mono/diheme cytochrome c family protein
MKILTIVALFFSWIIIGCQNAPDKSSISSDPATIAAGKAIFDKQCASCHGFKEDEIGPNLAGITGEVPADWILQFIRDPGQQISSGDKRADSLHKRFKSVMPSFSSLEKDSLAAILAFLNTQQKSAGTVKKGGRQPVSDPIPAKIAFSGLRAGIVPFTQLPASGTPGEMPRTRITKLDFMPGSGSLFVVDLRGKLYKIKNGSPRVYLDMQKRRPKFIAQPGLATGFGSFAFHPDFLKNGLLYTTHTESPGSGKPDFAYNDSIKVVVQWVLTEWKIKNPSADTAIGTSRELLRVNMVSGAHGMQEIRFNPLARRGDKDYGLLYIGIGDGACVQEGYPFITHHKNSIWGTIIRIDPLGHNSSNGRYGIPADNPFYHDKDSGTVKEMYANGFRNPHRISWTKSGDMLACNIGQANIESLYLVRPGKDYGWPEREGRFAFDPYGNLDAVYPLPADDSRYGFTYPVAQFDHDEGSAIAGGFEYTGAIPALKGKFLFGEISAGRLFYIEMADLKKAVLR